MSEALLYLLLIFSPLAHGAVEIWSVTILHVLTISIAALFVISLIRNGHLKLYRTPLDLSMLLIMFFMFLSFFMSSYPYASRIQIYKIINYSVLFYYITNVFRTRRQIFRLLYVLAVFGFIFAVGGLIFLSGSLPGLKIFSSGNPNVSFTFVNYNHFAGYLEMIVFLSLGLAFAHHGAKRYFLLTLCIFIAVAVIFSLSRGGIVGLFSGLVFFLIIFMVSREGLKIPWLLLLFMVLVLSIISWVGLEPVMERLETLKDPLNAGKDRLKIWTDVLGMISDNFWFGTGIGTFRYAFPRYFSGGTRIFINHAHNDYLELFAEMGITGILSVLLGVMVFFVTGWKNIIVLGQSRLQPVGMGALSGCFALMIHGMTDFNFHIPSNAILFTVCMAVALNSVIEKKELYSENKLMLIDLEVPERWRVSTYLFVSICSLVLVGLVISPYAGDLYLREARRLQISKDYESAIVAMDKALILDPGNAENMAAMGDLQVSRSSNAGSNWGKEMYMSSSLKYYDYAINACPVNSNYYSKKGFVLDQLGRKEEAEDSFINAVNFEPMNSIARYSLSYFYLKKGSVEKAYESFMTLLLMDSSLMTKVLDSIWSVSPSYESLKQAVPEMAAYRNEFAGYLFNKKEKEAALTELRLAFSLEPSVRNALAHIKGLCRVKEWNMAKESGERYLLQFGHEVSLLKQMVLIYEKLGHNEQSISIYQNLISYNPDDVSIYLSFADFYSEREQYPEAISVLAGAIQHIPDNENLYYALSDLYQADHKSKEAISLLEALLVYKPGDAEVYYKIAINYKAIRMPEKALEYLRLAISQRPKNADYRYTIGVWYRQLGLSQLSVEQFKKCLDINSGHNGCRRSVNEIYNEVGIAN